MESNLVRRLVGGSHLHRHRVRRRWQRLLLLNLELGIDTVAANLLVRGAYGHRHWLYWLWVHLLHLHRGHHHCTPGGGPTRHPLLLELELPRLLLGFGAAKSGRLGR